MAEDSALTVAKEITLAAMAKSGLPPGLSTSEPEKLGEWAGKIFKAVYKEVVSAEAAQPPRERGKSREY